MFREKYSNMNEQIFPEQELVEKVIQSIGGNKRKRNKMKNFFHKPITILAMLMAFVLTLTPVLAANEPNIYKLMYLVSPTIAQFFMPIQKSYEDNGIKMDLVSVYIHDNVAEIYITMQDLTGNRIDENTDLYDSYSINRPFDSLATCQSVGYNEKTRTATFLISISEWGNEKIVGDKITFSVKKFISNKKSYEDIEIPIDLSLVSNANETQEVFSMGGSGENYQIISTNDDYATALIPLKPIDEFPVEGIDLTAIGYIDGKLHIQTAVYDNLNKDNHGYFYLKDVEGQIINFDYNFSFVNQFHQPGRIDYSEYVFDIPQSKIIEYSLFGNFFTSASFTDGNWQITFPLEEMNNN